MNTAGVFAGKKTHLAWNAVYKLSCLLSALGVDDGVYTRFPHTYSEYVVRFIGEDDDETRGL